MIDRPMWVVLLQRGEEFIRFGRGEHGFGADFRGGLLDFAGEVDFPFLAESQDNPKAAPCKATIDRHFSQGSDAVG